MFKYSHHFESNRKIDHIKTLTFAELVLEADVVHCYSSILRLPNKALKNHVKVIIGHPKLSYVCQSPFRSLESKEENLKYLKIPK